MDELRKAVMFRIATGGADVLSAVTSVPIEALEHFAKTGEISAEHRTILEMMQ